MNSTGDYLIPGAIVVAGLLIASAVFYGGEGGQNTATNTHGNTLPNDGGVSEVRSVGEDDHIRGNPDASVTIIEYSDFECPFCGRLHPTLTRIVEENSDVKWVYRHFPLSSIHSRAQGAAVASECVARLADNDAFWSFSDVLFEKQRELGSNLYKSEAQKLGINERDFENCLADRAVVTAVTEDSNEAVQNGGRGTPFSILITASGEMIPFSGALPYAQVSALIEEARIN